VVPVSIETVTIDGREQSTWQAPDTYAAGWHESSARLGERENLVLNGHNTAHGEVFRDLYTLEPGATIRLHSDVITKTYAVAELLILKEAGQPMEVRLKNARYIMPTADERLTLVTCHPYGSLRNRLIVIARPVDDD
jgi:LPXTG-site transpeptidase (sortase) family protein